MIVPHTKFKLPNLKTTAPPSHSQAVILPLPWPQATLLHKYQLQLSPLQPYDGYHPSWAAFTHEPTIHNYPHCTQPMLDFKTTTIDPHKTLLSRQEYHHHYRDPPSPLSLPIPAGSSINAPNSFFTLPNELILYIHMKTHLSSIPNLPPVALKSHLMHIWNSISHTLQQSIFYSTTYFQPLSHRSRYTKSCNTSLLNTGKYYICSFMPHYCLPQIFFPFQGLFQAINWRIPTAGFFVPDGSTTN
jgi:hypothetical protein